MDTQNAHSAHARAIEQLGRGLERRVQRQFHRLRRTGCGQLLHPHAMRGATEPDHGVPAVRVLSQLLDRQPRQIQSDRSG